MNTKELNVKLRKARIEAGVKQEEIGNYLGLPVSAISVIEKGTRRVTVQELAKFATFYAKPIEWFFHDEKTEVNHRRWYDSDAALVEALDLLQKAPVKYQKSCAHAIIGFLKDSGLVK